MRVILIILSLSITLTLLVASLISPSAFIDPVNCYTFFGTAAACSLGIALLLISRDLGVAMGALILTIQALFFIIICGAMYSAYDLVPELENPMPLDGLYFSIVTWTTLGYGDIKPPHQLRLLSAFQALMGYLYFGLIVGSVSTLISRKIS